MISHLPQLMTPTPAPTTASTTTSIPALPDFSSLFGFDQRVSTLETELSQLKQADLSAQSSNLSNLNSTMGMTFLVTECGICTRKSSPVVTTQEFEKKAQEKRKVYIDVVEKYSTRTSLWLIWYAYHLREAMKTKDKDEDLQLVPDHRLKESILLTNFQSPQRNMQKSSGIEYHFEECYKAVTDRLDWTNPEVMKKYDYGYLEEIKVRIDDNTLYKFKECDFPNLNLRDIKDMLLLLVDRQNCSSRKASSHIMIGPAFNLLKRTYKSFVELEYHFEECYKVVTDQLDWNNPKGHEYPFNHSKPLPLIEVQGHQVVPVDYFFKNDLEYLKGGSSSTKYITSTTKTKAAKYDNIEGIKDMVRTLWSPVRVACDKFSMKRIIAVTHVKVMKWYGYGYLEEIIVRREDQIRIVILKQVEDLQLGVESYQKKLNITKPETFRSVISKLTPYTAYKNPQGIIYQDKLKRNRLMRSDELYKFYDGTLSSVRRVLHDIAFRLEMDYLPKRRWGNLDRKRSCIMIKEID
ncbi:hypothetical protein Tco_0083770 [Tanacetum coccineum]